MLKPRYTTYMYTLSSFIHCLLACQPNWVEEPSIQETDTQVITPDDENETPPSPPIVAIEAPSNALVDHSFTISAVDSYDPAGHDLSFIWTCSNGIGSRSASITIVEPSEQRLTCDVIVSTEATGLSTESSVNVTIYKPSDMAEWTLLIYIAGDNNLEEAGIVDINEMEMVGSSKDINVVVELDRSAQCYTGHDNWTGARRYYITEGFQDEIDSILLDDLGPVDSGNTDTFIDFFTWGARSFPSEKVALIFWNHGWSWSMAPQTQSTKGIMDDDSTGNDISVAEGELASILETFVVQTNRPIDFVGMDACTMMSWEVATEVAPWANTLVASQDYVSWDGWNYHDALKDLQENPSMDSLSLGDTFARRFWQTGDLSISVLDLEQLNQFNLALDAFADTILTEAPPLNIYAAARQSYSYDGSEYGIDHDLKGVIQAISTQLDNPLIDATAQETLDALELLVYQNYTQEYLDGAYGLSIYSPPSSNDGLDQVYLNARWSQNHLWDDLLTYATGEN